MNGNGLKEIREIIESLSVTDPEELIREAEEKEKAAAGEIDAGKWRTLYEEAISLRKKYIHRLTADEDRAEYEKQLGYCLSDIENLLPPAENDGEWIFSQTAVLALLLSLSPDRYAEYLTPIGLSLMKKAENDLRLGYRMDALNGYHTAALCIRYAVLHTERPTPEQLSATDTPELALTGAQERLLSGIMPEEFIPVLLSDLWETFAEKIAEFSARERKRESD